MIGGNRGIHVSVHGRKDERVGRLIIHAEMRMAILREECQISHRLPRESPDQVGTQDRFFASSVPEWQASLQGVSSHSVHLDRNVHHRKCQAAHRVWLKPSRRHLGCREKRGPDRQEKRERKELRVETGPLRTEVSEIHPEAEPIVCGKPCSHSYAERSRRGKLSRCLGGGSARRCGFGNADIRMATYGPPAVYVEESLASCVTGYDRKKKASKDQQGDWMGSMSAILHASAYITGVHPAACFSLDRPGWGRESTRPKHRYFSRPFRIGIGD